MARRTPQSVVTGAARLLAAAAAALPYASHGGGTGLEGLWGPGGPPGSSAVSPFTRAAGLEGLEEVVDVLEGIDVVLVDAAWAWLSPRGRLALLRLCHAGSATAAAGARREGREAGVASEAAAQKDQAAAAAAAAAVRTTSTGTFRATSTGRFKQRRPDILAAAALQGRSVLEGAFDLLAAFELQQLGVQVSDPPPSMLRAAADASAAPASGSGSNQRLLTIPGAVGGGGAPMISTLERRVLRRHVARAALVARVALMVHDSITGGTRKSWAVLTFKRRAAWRGEGGSSAIGSDAESAELAPEVVLAVLGSGEEGDSHGAAMRAHAGSHAEAHGGFRAGVASWLRRRRPFTQPEEQGNTFGSEPSWRWRSMRRSKSKVEVRSRIPAGAAPPPPAPPLPLPPPPRVPSFKSFAFRRPRAAAAEIDGGADNEGAGAASAGAAIAAALKRRSTAGASGVAGTTTATTAAGAAAGAGLMEPERPPTLDELWRATPLLTRAMYHAHVWLRTLWLAAMGDPSFWQDGIDMMGALPRSGAAARAGGAGWGGWVRWLLKLAWMQPLALLGRFSHVSVVG